MWLYQNKSCLIQICSWINASCCNPILIRLEDIQVYSSEKFLLKIPVFLYIFGSCWEALTLLPQLNSLSHLFPIPPSDCYALCYVGMESSSSFNLAIFEWIVFILSTLLSFHNLCHASVENQTRSEPGSKEKTNTEEHISNFDPFHKNVHDKNNIFS